MSICRDKIERVSYGMKHCYKRINIMKLPRAFIETAQLDTLRFVGSKVVGFELLIPTFQFEGSHAGSPF